MRKNESAGGIISVFGQLIVNAKQNEKLRF
jgi:hypothetical protein